MAVAGIFLTPMGMKLACYIAGAAPDKFPMDRLMKSATESGFTLIELMIALAILAILMAIALPAYQDLSIRAKNSECLSLAASAKTSVGTGFHTLASFSSESSAYEWAGSTRYCESITIDDDGVITATTQATGGNPAAVFELTPTRGNAGITWTCRETGGTSTAQIPAECRH